MNIEKYRKQYLASLYGNTWNDEQQRSFPIIRNPDRYAEWDISHPSQNALDLDIENVWVASDHHFDHKNIMKYADRKFDSVDHMNDCMIKAHNKVVSADDVIIMGGDIAFCATNKANGFIIVDVL